MTLNQVQENLERVLEKITAAAALAGRTRENVKLIAVTKTFPVERISLAVDAGQLSLGENRVQEAEPKIRHFRSSPRRVEWHMIGHLQSNKARIAADLFDMVQSVDSAKLAARLNDAAMALNKRLPVLIQVDLGQEPTKFGAAQEQVGGLVETISGLPGISLEGLMTIPPFFEDSERVRPYFAQLRELRDRIDALRPGCFGPGHLSMGMSHDFEFAIQEGATMVRVGSAVFGERRGG